MSKPAVPLPEPPRPFGLTPLMERTLRFLTGLGLTIYEAVLRHGEPRWPLLVIYSVMMGSPLAQRADEIRRIATDRLEDRR